MPNPDGFHSDRLKAALARRTGRSEEELCFEERRRSARVAEEETLGLEDSGLVLERGSRRARKEEPKLSDVRLLAHVFHSDSLSIRQTVGLFAFYFMLQSESPTTASIPELERQIDKLTKVKLMMRCTEAGSSASILLFLKHSVDPHSAKHFSVKSCYSHLIPCGPYCWGRTATGADT